MALITGTDDIDTAGRGKKLASWHISQGAGAQVVNFRKGALAGAIVFQVQVPATTSASQSYDSPLKIDTGEGWFIEVVASGLNFLTVNIL